MSTSLKKGDVVVCVKNYPGWLTKGKEYVVTSAFETDRADVVCVIGDGDEGEGGFAPYYFSTKPVGKMETAALPTDPTARKNTPMVRGLLDYFPAALAEVAAVSKAGNDQHNPGQPLHHARGKSTDHADCIVRHLMDRGTKDTDGQRHSAKVAWRALALLQEELEAEGAPLARGARKPDKKEGA